MTKQLKRQDINRLKFSRNTRIITIKTENHTKQSTADKHAAKSKNTQKKYKRTEQRKSCTKTKLKKIK